MTIPKQDTLSPSADLVFHEMLEFGNFPAMTQRYIVRSLQVFADPAVMDRKLAPSENEAGFLAAQADIYAGLRLLGQAAALSGSTVCEEDFLLVLYGAALFDLGSGTLPSFSAFRFLYERLLGAAARPWLLSAFCAAAAHPALPRSIGRLLLPSGVDAAASGWSGRQPIFFPQLAA